MEGQGPSSILSRLQLGVRPWRLIKFADPLDHLAHGCLVQTKLEDGESATSQMANEPAPLNSALQKVLQAPSIYIMAKLTDSRRARLAQELFHLAPCQSFYLLILAHTMAQLSVANVPNCTATLQPLWRFDGSKYNMQLGKSLNGLKTMTSSKRSKKGPPKVLNGYTAASQSR